MARMFERENKSNGSVQFLLKEIANTKKDDNNNGRQMSLPDEIFNCFYEQYYTIHKTVEDVKKENQGPPSPKLLVMTPRKRSKRVVDLHGDDEF